MNTLKSIFVHETKKMCICKKYKDEKTTRSQWFEYLERPYFVGLNIYFKTIVKEF